MVDSQSSNLEILLDRAEKRRAEWSEFADNVPSDVKLIEELKEALSVTAEKLLTVSLITASADIGIYSYRDALDKISDVSGFVGNLTED